jgi:hypothetical protein
MLVQMLVAHNAFHRSRSRLLSSLRALWFVGFRVEFHEPGLVVVVVIVVVRLVGCLFGRRVCGTAVVGVAADRAFVHTTRECELPGIRFPYEDAEDLTTAEALALGSTNDDRRAAFADGR